MAVLQINLSANGYVDAAGALAHTGLYDEITFIDDTAQSPTYFTTNSDGTVGGLSNPFDGQITDSGNVVNGWWKSDTGDVIQLNATGGVVSTATTTLATTLPTTTLPTWVLADAGTITVDDGVEGATVTANITGTGTISNINPATYVFGTDTYTVNITVPAGYTNTGATVPATITGVTVTQQAAISWDANNAADFVVPSSGQDSSSAPLEQYDMQGATQ